MLEKLPYPKTGIEAVDRTIRAILDRLMRFEIVGNFFGTPLDGQVPTYNAAKRQWEPKTPSGGGGGGVTDGDKGDVVVFGGGTTWSLDTAITTSINSKLPKPTTVELNFGSTPVTDKLFNIADAGVNASSKILANVCWLSTLGRSMDEIAVDSINIAIEPKSGSFDVRAVANWGMVAGKYGLAYSVG